MQTKTVYRYDEKTFIYMYPDVAFESPLEPGIFLIPANCTELKPLEPKEGFNIKFNGTEWVYEEIPQPPAPPEPTLEEVKERKIEELRHQRDAKEQEDINYDGKVVDYDRNSRDRLNIAAKALELSDPTGKITWTLADNTTAEFGIEDFNKILLLAAVRSNALHMKYRDLKAKVEACTTKEEVEKISWDIINDEKEK